MKITGGKFRDQTGMVVAVDDKTDTLTVITDVNNQGEGWFCSLFARSLDCTTDDLSMTGNKQLASLLLPSAAASSCVCSCCIAYKSEFFMDVLSL